jgi:hypothetical protein
MKVKWLLVGYKNGIDVKENEWIKIIIYEKINDIVKWNEYIY